MTAADVAIDVPETGAAAHHGPWALGLRRLRGNRSAMASAVVLVLVVLSAALAPFYASHIAQVDPFESNVSGTTEVDGKQVPVIQPNPSGLGSTPIGPTLERHYFLGADSQGRDVMARLLYGAGGAPAGSLCP